MENQAKCLTKTPMQQLIDQIDPMNSGVLLMAQKLLKEEERQFVFFGQRMYNKGYVDSYSGNMTQNPAQKNFNQQYESDEK